MGSPREYQELNVLAQLAKARGKHRFHHFKWNSYVFWNVLHRFVFGAIRIAHRDPGARRIERHEIQYAERLDLAECDSNYGVVSEAGKIGWVICGLLRFKILGGHPPEECYPTVPSDILLYLRQKILGSRMPIALRSWQSPAWSR